MHRYDDCEHDEPRIKFYGTAFPALKRDEAPSKKPDIDLTVRDEQGRRRFHGAFTGGFSAGYWNTVGSKEGWVPSQFVSSRKEGKWERDLLKEKPEDFMDEEDFMVHGIAPKSVHTKDLFSSDPLSDFLTSRTAAGASAASSSGPTGDLDLVQFLKESVRPVKLSIGLQILKKMKAGSKFLAESRDRAAATASSASKKKEKKSLPQDQTSDSNKVYGCSLPPGFAHFDEDSGEDEEQEEEGDEMENSFASYKSPFERKCNLHGLGYKGMLQPSSSSMTAASSASKPSLSLSADVAGKKLKISGDAFGVGVLDEENDDFDDVTLYEKEDMSIYDFEMRGERKKKNKNFRPTLCDSVHQSLEDMFVKESSSTSSSSRFRSLSKKYPPPEIPSGWRPAARFPLRENESREEDRSGRQKRDTRVNDRDYEYGKSSKKSRWDVREEHQKSSSSSSVPTTSSASKSAGLPPAPSRSMPGRVMDANVRSLLLGEGIKVGVRRQSVTEDQDVRQTVRKEKEEERQRTDCSQSSLSQKAALNQETERRSTPTPHPKTPLFGFFANKFTHSSSSYSAADGPVKLEAGLTRPSDISCMEKRDDVSAEAGGGQPVISMIGTSDRISLPWIPSSLLCKRFNVPQPGGSKNY